MNFAKEKKKNCHVQYYRMKNSMAPRYTTRIHAKKNHRFFPTILGKEAPSFTKQNCQKEVYLYRTTRPYYTIINITSVSSMPRRSLALIPRHLFRGFCWFWPRRDSWSLLLKAWRWGPSWPPTSRSCRSCHFCPCLCPRTPSERLAWLCRKKTQHAARKIQY